MPIREDLEVFDGVMLSDGGLSFLKWCKRAHFNIALSGAEHIDWLYFIKDTFADIGVEVCSNHPKIVDRLGPTGKPFKCCILTARVSNFLDEQYKRWYPNGKKEVPMDFMFTPVSLANEFMGDGSSRRDKRSPTTVSLDLNTLCFSVCGIEQLEESLNTIGIIHIGRKHHGVNSLGAGISITIRQDSVDVFMNMVKPYMLPSYDYKIKFKGGKQDAS